MRLLSVSRRRGRLLLVIPGFPSPQATTTPAYTKYRMFRALLYCASLYFVLDATIFFALATNHHVQQWVSAASRLALELVATLAIGSAFRARPLNALFEHVQASNCSLHLA